MTHQHPFEFATYPRRLNQALRRREITHDEYVILVAGLYARANRSTWIATLTLDQLFEAIAWEGSADWLYRRLRDLKRRGWIDYASQPGKKRHSYAIKLRYDRSVDSKEGPSTQPLNEAEFHVAALRTAPSSGLDTPSTDDGEIPLPEPVSAKPTADRVRAPRDVRDTPTSRIEENVLGGGLNRSEVLGGAGERVQSHAGVRSGEDLVGALISELDLRLTDPDRPLCRYPSHRRTDWLGHGGKLICGICHPPAVPSPPSPAFGVAGVADDARDGGSV